MIKNKKLSGSITVFAALIFLAVFSLFITLIQSAYHSATKARIDSALALAAESAFAGYSNEVFNRYGIFVLSSSSDALARTKEVLAANMAGSKAGLTGVSFTNEIRMTDNGGEPFYRQAVDYMKSEGVAAYVNDMLSDESKTAQNGGKIGDLAEKLGNSTNTGASEEKILEDINRIMGEENAGDTSGVSSSVKRDLQNAAEKETGQGEVQRDEKNTVPFLKGAGTSGTPGKQTALILPAAPGQRQVLSESIPPRSIHSHPLHNKEETPGKCTVTGGLFRSKNKYATGNP